MKTYNTRYKLKQDLPGYEKGRELGVEVRKGNLQWRFFEWDDLFNKWGYKTTGEIHFSIEEIQDTRFFEPIGAVRDVIPKFPNKDKIKDYYYLIGEARQESSVDIIRSVDPIFESDEFYDGVYELLKEIYNKKYKL